MIAFMLVAAVTGWWSTPSYICIYDFTKFLSHKPLERFGCKIKSENFPETNISQLKTDSLKDVLSLSFLGGLKTAVIFRS